MHSSRMRTDRALTVFPYLGGGGVFLLGGRYLPPGKGSVSWGGCLLRQTPVNRMTHACENITFPASLRYAVDT